MFRGFVVSASIALGLGACADLMPDGTSVSVGKPSNGYLENGHKLPDHGDGYTTKPIWRERGNRYGTDELVALVEGVARRERAPSGIRAVIADLSGRGGAGGEAFHRSHQNGRDVDVVYFVRDEHGKAFEPDVMRVFDAKLHAKDGVSIDVPRTWAFAKDLLTAPEANVQWIFMYQPIANALIEYAEHHGERPEVIARAKLAMKQPSDSARHDDHFHVRVFCTDADRERGCQDIGPQELKVGWAGATLAPDVRLAAQHTARGFEPALVPTAAAISTAAGAAATTGLADRQ